MVGLQQAHLDLVTKINFEYSTQKSHLVFSLNPTSLTKGANTALDRIAKKE